jgi:hypothetical protein
MDVVVLLFEKHKAEKYEIKPKSGHGPGRLAKQVADGHRK